MLTTNKINDLPRQTPVKYGRNRNSRATGGAGDEQLVGARDRFARDDQDDVGALAELQADQFPLLLPVILLLRLWPPADKRVALEWIIVADSSKLVPRKFSNWHIRASVYLTATGLICERQYGQLPDFMVTQTGDMRHRELAIRSRVERIWLGTLVL